MILGACNPPLAHAALQAEPSIGLLLPCNVVVRSTSEDTTIVEAVDPQTMVALTANPALQAGGRRRQPAAHRSPEQPHSRPDERRPKWFSLTQAS